MSTDQYISQLTETLRWLAYYQAWLDGYERGRDDEAKAEGLERLTERAHESWKHRADTWGKPAPLSPDALAAINEAQPLITGTDSDDA